MAKCHMRDRLNPVHLFLCSLVLAFFPLHAWAQVIFADSFEDVSIALNQIGVNATPNAFFANEPTVVRVQAQFPASPGLDTGSVMLFGAPGSAILSNVKFCDLLDNGSVSDGDDIAGDSVYSCFVLMNIPSPGLLQLVVKFVDNGQARSSLPFGLEIAVMYSSDEINELLNGQAAAQAAWNTRMGQLGDTEAARLATIEDIKLLPGVESAGLSEDGFTIWIHYSSGARGGLMLNPEGTRGRPSRAEPIPEGLGPMEPAEFTSLDRVNPLSQDTPQPGVAIALADEPELVGNHRVLIWDAYNHQFAPFDEGPQLQALFQNAVCPLFEVTYLLDAQATVESVRSFPNFDTIILVTHGAVDGDGQVVFLTDETATFASVLANLLYISLGRISVMGSVFAIRPSFIATLPGAFDRAIVYNGSCQSSANGTMSAAFMGKGANTYYGFTRVVNSDFAQSVANQLFAGLVTDLKKTDEAFTPVTPKVDPTAPNAVFTQSGSLTTAYSTQLRNGDFEDGLEAWTSFGDGRVVSGLGGEAVTPPGGSRMGLVSTGLGFSEDAGGLSQSFCLSPNAQFLNIEWNFLSEEFFEWCDSVFDDYFRVRLVSQTGLDETVFQASVNTICVGQPVGASATSLFFDQSGPGCEPVESINDCTVGGTGWQNTQINISAFATANNGKGVELIIEAGDVGDSLFDTAVPVDNVAIELAPPP